VGEVSGGPIEQKAVAGPFTTLIAGYLASVLITTVPWISSHLTADQQQNIPIIIAFALSAIASYLAPHTHRPDLSAPGTELRVQLPPGAVPAAQAPPKA
jgi:hypothetical protein